MRNSQVAKPLSPRKSFFIERHARRKTSCVISAASSGEPDERSAIAYTRFRSALPAPQRRKARRAAPAPQYACRPLRLPLFSYLIYYMFSFAETKAFSSSAISYRSLSLVSAQMRFLNVLTPLSRLR